MPFPMKLDGEEEKREGGGREKRDNKFSYIKGCHSKNISHTSLLPVFLLSSFLQCTKQRERPRVPMPT